MIKFNYFHNNNKMNLLIVRYLIEHLFENFCNIDCRGVCCVFTEYTKRLYALYSVQNEKYFLYIIFTIAFITFQISFSRLILIISLIDDIFNYERHSKLIT